MAVERLISPCCGVPGRSCVGDASRDRVRALTTAAVPIITPAVPTDSGIEAPKATPR
jgi:hypothetical protein